MQNSLFRASMLLLLCAAFLPSCRPKNVTCTNGTIQVNPVGFSETDFDSANVIKYTQGSSFSAPVDSTTNVHYSIYPSSADTGSIYALSTSDSTHPVFIVPGFDYRIVLPAIARSFTISNIVQSGKTHESYTSGFIGGDKLIVCYNSVTSVTVDGNVFTGLADKPAISVNIVK